MDETGKAMQHVVEFQFNPDSLTRSLSPRSAAASGDGREATRLTGPPVESLRFEIVLDATASNRAQGEVLIAPGQNGILTDLAVLEALLSPKVADMKSSMDQAKQGVLEILPMPSHLLLLVLGSKRVLPVRLIEMHITEQQFDVELNPIRARLAIEASVLTVDDVAWGSKAAEVFLAALSAKEARARKAGGALSALGLSQAL